MDLRQLFTRPVARLDPYTTPDPRLFLCSSSTPPGGGIHGMCGWHAAHSALRRLSTPDCQHRPQPGGHDEQPARTSADLPLLEIWGEAVRARRVQGERITLAIVELAPNAVVPEHTHAAEQLGMVIRGQMHFTVDGETRDLGPGGTWRILGDRPHDVVAGPEGAVVIDVFTPGPRPTGTRRRSSTRLRPRPRWPRGVTARDLYKLRRNLPELSRADGRGRARRLGRRGQRGHERRGDPRPGRPGRRDLRRGLDLRLPRPPPDPRDRPRPAAQPRVAGAHAARPRGSASATSSCFTGAEPDYRWHELSVDVVALAQRLGVARVDQPRRDPGRRAPHPPSAHPRHGVALRPAQGRRASRPRGRPARARRRRSRSSTSRSRRRASRRSATSRRSRTTSRASTRRRRSTCCARSGATSTWSSTSGACPRRRA